MLPSNFLLTLSIPAIDKLSRIPIYQQLSDMRSYPFLLGKKTVLFGQKWRISAPGIVINNPKIIDLFSYKFYGGPHKGGFGIVNYNPRRTYCPLVPKQYTLRAAKGSLMRVVIQNAIW